MRYIRDLYHQKRYHIDVALSMFVKKYDKKTVNKCLGRAHDAIPLILRKKYCVFLRNLDFVQNLPS